jgi:hypothetical protein
MTAASEKRWLASRRNIDHVKYVERPERNGSCLDVSELSKDESVCQAEAPSALAGARWLRLEDLGTAGSSISMTYPARVV